MNNLESEGTEIPKKKSKYGRNKLLNDDVRDKQKVLAFTKIELDHLSQLHLLSTNKTFAVFLRELLLNHAEKIVFTPQVNVKTLAEVRKCGSNLNQIAKQLNKKSGEVYISEMENTLREINNNLIDIKKILQP